MGALFAGHYELVDLIGLGRTGVMWRAWDHRQQTYVAAKLVRQADASSLLTFVRRHATSLRHRHLLVPRAWAGAEEQVLFSADLVPGGPASALLVESGPLPSAWVTVLLDQVLDGLAALHDLGTVHGEIRTSRLLLEATGQDRPHVWLSGFGSTVGGGDPRHDLYELGLAAAELLTGLRPDPVAGVGPAPLSVPEPLWQWVRRLAAPSRAERPASAARARAELAVTGAQPPDGAWPVHLMGALNVPDRLGELPEGWAPDGPGPKEPVVAPGSRMYEELTSVSVSVERPEPEVMPGTGVVFEQGVVPEPEVMPETGVVPEPGVMPEQTSDVGPVRDDALVDAPPEVRQPVDSTPVDSRPADAPPSDRSPVDRPPVDRSPTDRSPTDRPPLDEQPTDRAFPNRWPFPDHPAPEAVPRAEPVGPEPAAAERPPELGAPGFEAPARVEPKQPDQTARFDQAAWSEPSGRSQQSGVAPLSHRAGQVRRLGHLRPPGEQDLPPSELPPLDLEEEPHASWKRWLFVLLALVVLAVVAYGVLIFVPVPLR